MEYIYLQQAADISGYSQDYLRLRARQGKLKSLKFGRNWVTKKEWIEEYLSRVREYKKQRVVVPSQPMPVQRIPVRLVKIKPPPQNLPIKLENRPMGQFSIFCRRIFWAKL